MRNRSLWWLSPSIWRNRELFVSLFWALVWKILALVEKILNLCTISVMKMQKKVKFNRFFTIDTNDNLLIGRKTRHISCRRRSRTRCNTWGSGHYRHRRYIRPEVRSDVNESINFIDHEMVNQMTYLTETGAVVAVSMSGTVESTRRIVGEHFGQPEG